MSKTTTTKKTATVNATATNNVVKIDFTEFLNHVNDKNDKNELLCATKNNTQLLLAKCGVMVNANSTKCVPNDAYVRFKNNTQFQLEYSKKTNSFVGFNIRLCSDEHTKLFKKWLTFQPCNDNARIAKSDYINGFEHFTEIINIMMNLPKFDRNREIKTATE